MSVRLRTHAAVDRATGERERVEEKRAAFERFAARVENVSPESPATGDALTKNGASMKRGTSAKTLRRASAGVTPASNGNAPGGVLTAGSPSASSGGVGAIRAAFRELVLPLTAADSVDEALADELSPDLAAAFAPAANGFGPEPKRQLLERVRERRTECRLLADAIDDEREQLRDATEELDGVVAWLVSADETPLTELEFEQLRERHERLETHRERCDELAAERQAALGGTRNDGLTGIRKRDVLALLYDDFAVDHPVLADVARLTDLLADCQRTVRRHLCTRA